MRSSSLCSALVRMTTACIVCLSGMISAAQGVGTLTLLHTVPLSELKDMDGQAITLTNISPSNDREVGVSTLKFGFISGGKAVYLGRGRVLELSKPGVEQRYSASLKYERISKDGRILYATKASGGLSEEYFAWDTLLNVPFIAKGRIPTSSVEIALHPDGVTYAKGYLGVSHYLEDVAIINTISGAVGGPSSKNPLTGDFVHSITQFSDDGHYLVVDGTTLIDTHTFKWLTMPEVTTNKKPWEEKEPNYIGDSKSFVFNRDASRVAGKKGPNDWSTFVWDRVNKKSLWKDPMVSEPSAFSPNGQYLYCCDTINETATGKAIFENLKGLLGKFSPDGRSLVTVDDEAFYIYTLPKDSEPIFGVFQKPEPWSPLKPAKQSKPSTRKPLQKPIKKP